MGGVLARGTLFSAVITLLRLHPKAETVSQVHSHSVKLRAPCGLGNLRWKRTLKWGKDCATEAGRALVPSLSQSWSRFHVRMFPTTAGPLSGAREALPGNPDVPWGAGRGRAGAGNVMSPLLPEQKENCSFPLFLKNTLKMTSRGR